MKTLTIIVFVLLGLYWFVAHGEPFPLSHESFGLYNHTIHRIIGIVLLVIAAFIGWRWKRN